MNRIINENGEILLPDKLIDCCWFTCVLDVWFTIGCWLKYDDGGTFCVILVNAGLNLLAFFESLSSIYLHLYSHYRRIPNFSVTPTGIGRLQVVSKWYLTNLVSLWANYSAYLHTLMLIVLRCHISFSLYCSIACLHHLRLNLHAHELSSFCWFEAVRRHSKLLDRSDHFVATSYRFLNRFKKSSTFS